MATKWTMYVQNPEDEDEQGIYLKAEGEDEPWLTETDTEEFDAWHDPSVAGWAITDLDSARKWAKDIYRLKGEIDKLVWW